MLLTYINARLIAAAKALLLNIPAAKLAARSFRSRFSLPIKL
jgi:hypothetical protein